MTAIGIIILCCAIALFAFGAGLLIGRDIGIEDGYNEFLEEQTAADDARHMKRDEERERRKRKAKGGAR